MPRLPPSRSSTSAGANGWSAASVAITKDLSRLGRNSATNFTPAIPAAKSGLVYCADCGSRMQYGSSNNGDLSQDFFDCSLHKEDRKKCGGHFIRVKVLERMVLKHIQMVTGWGLSPWMS